MKILLLGEYSNVHWTLAQGLRTLGHEVTVLSNGDFWKDYPRDISLVRHTSKLGGVVYMARLASILPRLRGYDIVQLINPMFLELKAERISPVYRWIRRHNKKVILCGFGMDYYWVSTCCHNSPFLYSDFNIGSTLRANADALYERKDWLGTAKERLNKMIAQDCDHIVTGLYEYQRCYQPAFGNKSTFIPFPVKCDKPPRPDRPQGDKLKVFIGINRTRSEYKGTDIMLAAARDVEARHPSLMSLTTAESVPFAQYCKMMDSADAILDQLYSYTPAMNALEAMSRGLICIGGGEEENYDILGEKTLRPIVNVRPDYQSVYDALEHLALNPLDIGRLQRESVAYVSKHHDHIKVARRYERLYDDLLSQ